MFITKPGQGLITTKWLRCRLSVLTSEGENVDEVRHLHGVVEMEELGMVTFFSNTVSVLFCPWDFVNAVVLSPGSVPVICLLIYLTVTHWALAVCHPVTVLSLSWYSRCLHPVTFYGWVLFWTDFGLPSLVVFTTYLTVNRPPRSCASDSCSVRCRTWTTTAATRQSTGYPVWCYRCVIRDLPQPGQPGP